MALQLFQNAPKSIFTSFLFARNTPFSEPDWKTVVNGEKRYFQHGESGHFL